MTVKELIKGNVSFLFYQAGCLHYETASGFEFRVPITDTGGGRFLVKDKGIMFMRYIRKELEEINESKS